MLREPSQETDCRMYAADSCDGDFYLRRPWISNSGLQSTPQNKVQNSNGCSDIHHKIGSGRVIYFSRDF
jgi:hypothetical protein